MVRPVETVKFGGEHHEIHPSWRDNMMAGVPLRGKEGMQELIDRMGRAGRDARRTNLDRIKQDRVRRFLTLFSQAVAADLRFRMKIAEGKGLPMNEETLKRVLGEIEHEHGSRECWPGMMEQAIGNLYQKGILRKLDSESGHK